MLRRYLLWSAGAIGSALLLLIAVVVLGPAVAKAQFIRQAAPELTALEVVALILGQDVLVERLVVSGTSTTEDTVTILKGRLRMDPLNSGAVFYWDNNNGFNLGNQLNMADAAFIAVDNLAPKRQSTESLKVYGVHGFTLVPQAAVDACTADRKGQLTTLTGDGRIYHCDGAANGKLAHIFSGAAALDFPLLAANEKSSALTVTVAGAATTDRDVHCQAGASLGDNLQVFEAWVSSADTVSLRLWNTDGSSSEDLPATTFTCTVKR